MLGLLLLAASPLLQAADEDKALEAARAAMLSAKYCFLITVDEEGQPQARLMEPFSPDAGMTVWMGTNPKTRKVAQIRRNAHATLAYYDTKGPNYVTLTGKASIVTDLAERRKHWRKEFEIHFPGGLEGSNYALISFTPMRIELVSVSAGIASKPASLLPAILDRTKDGWRLR